MLRVKGSLPEPSMYYLPHRSPLSVFLTSERLKDAFALFGKSKVLCSDATGFATMYNPDLHSFLSVPELNSPKGPILHCYLHPPYRCGLDELGFRQVLHHQVLHCTDDQDDYECHVVVCTGVEVMPSHGVEGVLSIFFMSSVGDVLHIFFVISWSTILLLSVSPCTSD